MKKYLLLIVFAIICAVPSQGFAADVFSNDARDWVINSVTTSNQDPDKYQIMITGQLTQIVGQNQISLNIQDQSMSQHVNTIVD